MFISYSRASVFFLCDDLNNIMKNDVYMMDILKIWVNHFNDQNNNQ